MRDDARERALAFLLETHLLSPDEARDALAVAVEVLHSGLTRLAATAGDGNGAACAEAAHSLKGNLLNLGLPELAHTAQQAMNLARQGDLDAARAAGTTLSQALRSLLDSPPDAPADSLAAGSQP